MILRLRARKVRICLHTPATSSLDAILPVSTVLTTWHSLCVCFHSYYNALYESSLQSSIPIYSGIPLPQTRHYSSRTVPCFPVQEPQNTANFTERDPTEDNPHHLSPTLTPIFILPTPTQPQKSNPNPPSPSLPFQPQTPSHLSSHLLTSHPLPPPPPHLPPHNLKPRSKKNPQNYHPYHIH